MVIKGRDQHTGMFACDIRGYHTSSVSGFYGHYKKCAENIPNRVDQSAFTRQAMKTKSPSRFRSALGSRINNDLRHISHNLCRLETPTLLLGCHASGVSNLHHMSKREVEVHMLTRAIVILRHWCKNWSPPRNMTEGWWMTTAYCPLIQIFDRLERCDILNTDIKGVYQTTAASDKEDETLRWRLPVLRWKDSTKQMEFRRSD